MGDVPAGSVYTECTSHQLTQKYMLLVPQGRESHIVEFFTWLCSQQSPETGAEEAHPLQVFGRSVLIVPVPDGGPASSLEDVKSDCDVIYRAQTLSLEAFADSAVHTINRSS